MIRKTEKIIVVSALLHSQSMIGKMIRRFEEKDTRKVSALIAKVLRVTN